MTVAPLVIAGAAFLWLPDSIRFLLIKGGAEDRARKYLERISPGTALPRTLTTSPGERESRDSFIVLQLFAGRRATGTLLIWTVYFMNLLNLYFLNSWLPTIMSDTNIAVATAIRLTTIKPRTMRTTNPVTTTAAPSTKVRTRINPHRNRCARSQAARSR